MAREVPCTGIPLELSVNQADTSRTSDCDRHRAVEDGTRIHRLVIAGKAPTCESR